MDSGEKAVTGFLKPNAFSVEVLVNETSFQRGGKRKPKIMTRTLKCETGALCRGLLG
jgi:hypothetical protein